MAKWAKIILVVSLVLNVGLIIGYGYYTSYARAKIFKSAAMSVEFEEKVLKRVLSTLESDDPAKITALKERLPKDIEKAQKLSSNLRQASEW